MPQMALDDVSVLALYFHEAGAVFVLAVLNDYLDSKRSRGQLDVEPAFPIGDNGGMSAGSLMIVQQGDAFFHGRRRHDLDFIGTRLFYVNFPRTDAVRPTAGLRPAPVLPCQDRDRLLVRADVDARRIIAARVGNVLEPLLVAILH